MTHAGCQNPIGTFLLLTKDINMGYHDSTHAQYFAGASKMICFQRTATHTGYTIGYDPAIQQ